MSALRWAAAVLLALHGIAHLPGFLAAWQLSRNPGLAYKTTASSLVLSVINWPDSRIGVAINLLILMALALASASDKVWLLNG